MDLSTNKIVDYEEMRNQGYNGKTIAFITSNRLVWFLGR